MRPHLINPLAVYGILHHELIPSLLPSTAQHDGAPLGRAYWARVQLLNRPVAHHRWLARAGVASQRPHKPGRMRGHKEGPVLVDPRQHVRLWKPEMEDIGAPARHGRCVVRQSDDVVPAQRGRVSVQLVRARRSLPGEKEERSELIRPAEGGSQRPGWSAPSPPISSHLHVRARTNSYRSNRTQAYSAGRKPDQTWSRCQEQACQEQLTPSTHVRGRPQHEHLTGGHPLGMDGLHKLSRPRSRLDCQHCHVPGHGWIASMGAPWRPCYHDRGATCLS